MAHTDKIKITRGSGNVFQDLSISDADEHELKARVVVALQRLIEVRNLSQVEASRRIGIAQPDLSKILRGNFRGFSLERLLGALRALGSDVEIKVKARMDNDKQGVLRLVVA